MEKILSPQRLKTAVWPLLCLGLLLGCSGEQAAKTDTGRWYTQAQVTTGQGLFRSHCAECHGNHAEGTKEWRTPTAEGKYPPPPLNGTAHAWHHPLPVLMRTIEEGGIALGGSMPGFGDRFSDQQKRALIAFFQSQWSDEVYAAWEKRGH